MVKKVKLTETAKTVLKKRYYLRNDKDEIIEEWSKLCKRVSEHVSKPDAKLNGTISSAFYNIMYNLDFIPNSPCLMNAGIPLGQLAACFVLPIEDNIDSIYKYYKDAAKISKSGGGVGASFSKIRPKNSTVKTTNGVASGPLSFASVQDRSTEIIKQGGRRRGANMGVLSIHHPDILNFINAKENDGDFSNFNFSVAITDEFMEALKNDQNYNLYNPTNGYKVDELNSKEVFDLIVDKTWNGGDPGILFIDTANNANTLPHLGDFESTNPCGEQFLLSYESCNLGSINLSNFIVNGKIDYVRLAKITRTATRFLDNVIDVNIYPIPEIEEMTLSSRKIGLGIMGLHDMLIQLEIEYASEEGREVAADVMKFIENESKKESELLAKEKGFFPAYDEVHCDFPERRNGALTSIQPTGSGSMIADCSSGCESYYSVIVEKHVMDGEKLLLVNKYFEIIAKREGFYSEHLINEIAKDGTVVGNKKIPEKWQNIFRGAMDISVEDHIKMQAALQNNGIHSSISKTINMPANATREDVKKAYLMGYKLGCKGLTVYRDGSKEGQVLNAGKKAEKIKKFVKKELPDELPAKRYKLKSKDGDSIYIIVCFDENEEPVEIFAKFAYDNRIESQEKAMMWTTVCRLVSLALRCGTPISEIIKQFDRSSGSMFDLPSQLGKLLKTFMSKTKKGYKIRCGECGGEVVFIEGCEKCLSCGLSKCN